MTTNGLGNVYPTWSVYHGSVTSKERDYLTDFPLYTSVVSRDRFHVCQSPVEGLYLPFVAGIVYIGIV